MIPAGDRLKLHLAPNPNFLPGKPFSYEDVLCRLAGWWTMATSTLTAREVITQTLARAVLALVLLGAVGACARPPKEPLCLTWITPCR
jgi:hypothetical protein